MNKPREGKLRIKRSAMIAGIDPNAHKSLKLNVNSNKDEKKDDPANKR